MKKSLLVGLLSLAVTAVSSYGQGIITLDNYLSNGGAGGPNFITYGAGVPINGASGATGSGGIQAGWTVGFYWAAGNQLANVTTDGSGIAIPTGGGLTLATGSGSTAASAPFGTAGTYLGSATYTTPGVATGGTITVDVIAYDTADGSYANAAFRGHSGAFLMTVADPTGAPNKTGDAPMPGFSVLPVPEPSIFALSGLGAAALMLIRRKKLA
ncbi:MAG TPA: PEP-CTERM sorting domain-containing protein [Candidatus Angelobacter sp.]|nr:PEP-CTERM sorting domain-containing protein [Candidatus Angelobacter sp.]